ncbi:hypothetical protein HJC23_000698 [Cyclotella cryptica]|uniref:Uncharacterized protein n=1 Tax=Cyclotella cryptica TaxID=29204 RepID=A0ABD3Q9Z3_9STRA|eukprot:CCRYP_007380-RA/>CCRYP_007380-RA protein AED:0.22 eAED:0.22 QI:0/-1/0/1/-1/1/1/0/884
MRISRQSIDRRISFADLLSRARMSRSTLGARRLVHLCAAATVAVILIIRIFHAHDHSTIDKERELANVTPPSHPVPSLRSSARSDRPKDNSFPFLDHTDNNYIPRITKQLSPPSDAAFVVFYNLFIPKESKGAEYATLVMKEQLNQVATALKREDNDSSSRIQKKEYLLRKKAAVVYYNLIGKPLRPEKMEEYCATLHPRLECKMIGYYEEASESVTLQDIHDFCQTDHNHGDDTQSNRDVRVTYIHSKGSYHHTDVNTNWRRELTNAVLHPQCLSPPDDRCNVCGTSFFTRFAFMFPGNMWTAKCSYIRRLLPPRDGGEYDAKKKESIVEFLKMRLYGRLSTTLLEDRIDYFGLGRYRLEHWIGSHPTIMPCELHRKNITLGYMVGGGVNATRDYDWGMGPRREEVVPEIISAQNNLQDKEVAFGEYYLLSGNLIKWFTLYGSDGIPDRDSWVWTFFPAGDRWRELVAKYGQNAVKEVAMQSSEFYSAYLTNGTRTLTTTEKDNELQSNSKSPVVVFYHIALPQYRKKESLYSVKVQLDVLSKGQYDIQTRTFDHDRPTILYYTIAEGDSFNSEFISNYCKTQAKQGGNLTCHSLGELPSANARGETLVQLYNYCQANPSSRVTYITNQHPPTHGFNTTRERHPMQKLRAYATAVTSKMCVRSRDSCNVCGMEFYALPYFHFSGNTFTADCEYVNKLLPPQRFEEAMNNHAGEALVTHLERSFTTNLFPFTPQNLGLSHYSVEHWIGSHPDIKPCDVAPIVTSWFPFLTGNAYTSNDYSSSRIYDFRWGLAPRRGSAPIGTLPAAKEKEVIEMETLLFREYFHMAGHLHRWYHLYGVAPPGNSWVWDWFAKGDVWREGVAVNGSAVINEITMRYADPNQGVPF